MNIGIVGVGYVGKALYEGLKEFKVGTYDIKEDCNFSSIRQLCKFANVIFVCVPTPMNEDGSCNIDIVESVICDIDRQGFQNTVVIKSTVPPGTTNTFINKYKNIQIVFSPEFLTEANYIDDFKNSNRVIFGGCLDNTQKLKDMFTRVYPSKTYVQTDATTAEMVKYVANTFLATKVAFANEMYDICNFIGISYEEVVGFAKLDQRLGDSHWQVPGPDGKRGFGGSCFPKDINGLIAHAQSVGVEPSLLKRVWANNLQVRPERDWEELVGRAISKKELNNE